MGHWGGAENRAPLQVISQFANIARPTEQLKLLDEFGSSKPFKIGRSRVAFGLRTDNQHSGLARTRVRFTIALRLTLVCGDPLFPSASENRSQTKVRKEP